MGGLKHSMRKGRRMNELMMQIVLGCGGVIITACVAFLTKITVVWLKDKKLFNAATDAVNYADQLLKNGTITKEQRMEKALSFLKAKGIDIPTELADMIIESVLGGINSGLKKEV